MADQDDHAILTEIIARNLIREMRTYIWNPNIPNKPLKRGDDAVDALRYLVFSDGRDLKPIPGLKLENKYFKAALRR